MGVDLRVTCARADLHSGSTTLEFGAAILVKQRFQRVEQHCDVILGLVEGRHLFAMFKSEYTAVCADRTEYSTVKTTSSGNSQYCPMNAMFVVPVGLTSGRSPLTLGMNWLVMNGLCHKKPGALRFNR